MAHWVTFNHLTAVLANLGAPKVFGGYSVSCSSTRRAGRTIQGTSGLSAWPQCQEWLWSSDSTNLEMAINFCAIMWHVQSKQVMRSSQLRFTKVRSCLMNLIIFCNTFCKSSLCGEGSVDIFYLVLIKLWHGLNSPGEAVCSWLGQVYCFLGWKLTGWPSHGGEWR